MKTLPKTTSLLVLLTVNSVEPARAALDLKMVSLTKRNGDVPIQQVGIVGHRAGFTFSVKTENVGDQFIPWGFSMYEDAKTPWVMANKGTVYPGGGTSKQGFSGVTEGLNFPHTFEMPNPAPGPRVQDDANAANYVGSHPHLQLTLWAQPAGTGPWQKIGASDLKHAFSTVFPSGGGDDHPAFSGPGEIDDYGNDSDRDRDFYGPMSELNTTTFEVVNHAHLSNNGPVKFTDSYGYDVYERAHGEKEHQGVGQELDHLLQTDVLCLLTTGQQFDGVNGLFDVNTKWYAAGTWYVVGDANNNNNTVYRQFGPGWNGTQFAPSWIGDSFDGSMNNAPARFLLPTMAGAATVCPDSGSTSLLLLGGMALLLGTAKKRTT